MTQKLALFPLHTVLLPGAPLSLHIFEERYRLMIGRCLEQSLPFGVVLIRSGSEVDPDDPWIQQMRERLGGGDLEDLSRETIPFEIGTVARISESVRLEDGRYYLVALGQRRFRIQYLIQRAPYLVASVTYLPEDTTTSGSDTVQQLRDLYMRYWATLAIATGQQYESETLPDEAVELSYWMAHRLNVDTVRKQRWLEADVGTRLREMSAALRTELSMLPDRKPPDAEDRPWSWN